MKICYGTTRTVLLVGRYAIKVPAFVEWRLFLLGLLANMQETRFSTLNDERLCPVLWSIWGGFLLIMARADELSRDEFAIWSSSSIRKRMVIEVESKLSSWGWHDGRIVAVDYGN